MNLTATCAGGSAATYSKFTKIKFKIMKKKTHKIPLPKKKGNEIQKHNDFYRHRSANVLTINRRIITGHHLRYIQLFL